MVTIEIDPGCYEHVSPTLMAQGAAKLVRILERRRLRGGQKWQEPIDVAGNYIGFNCHYYAAEDTVVVTGARYLRKKP